MQFALEPHFVANAPKRTCQVGRTGPGARSDRGAGFPVTTGGGGLTVILASFQIAAGERQLKILSGKGRVRTQPLARSKEPPVMVSPPLLPVTRSPSRTDGQTRTDGRTVTVGPPRWRKDGQPVTDGSQRTAAGGLPQSPRPRPGARPGSLPQDRASCRHGSARPGGSPGPLHGVQVGRSRRRPASHGGRGSESESCTYKPSRLRPQAAI